MPIKYDDQGKIKKPGKVIQYDQAMLANYAACIHDVKFFATHYFYIINQVTGSQLISLRDYQEEMLDNYVNNRFNIVMAARQSGKCVSSDAIIKIRNKETNEEIEIPIEQFLEMVKKIT